MSATNWRACPRCAAQEHKAAAKVEEKARKSYGKVSAQKFMELLAAAERSRKKADAFEDTESEHTFAEDYHVHTSIDGMFSVNYFGACQSCGYEVKFKHEMLVPPDEEAKRS